MLICNMAQIRDDHSHTHVDLPLKPCSELIPKIINILYTCDIRVITLYKHVNIIYCFLSNSSFIHSLRRTDLLFGLIKLYIVFKIHYAFILKILSFRAATF